MSWLKKLTSGLRKSSEKVTQNLSSLSRLFGKEKIDAASLEELEDCLLYTSPSPRDLSTSRMPSSA